jgi:hypothetical protein
MISITTAAKTKELLWIDQSNQRFYAYNHFGQHPQRLIEWFDTYRGPPTAVSMGVLTSRLFKVCSAHA